MDLQQILDMWQEDCQIDRFQLDETSRITPTLHAKYLGHLSHTKLKLRKAQADQKSMLKDKWLYYGGKMTEEQLSSKGWVPDPFDGMKVLKGDMEYYYDSDPEIRESEDLIMYYKTVIDTLKEIVDTLRWRHQTIGNMIKWRQFEAGG